MCRNGIVVKTHCARSGEQIALTIWANNTDIDRYAESALLEGAYQWAAEINMIEIQLQLACIWASAV